VYQDVADEDAVRAISKKLKADACSMVAEDSLDAAGALCGSRVLLLRATVLLVATHGAI
jgi:hypothetical protein